MGSIRLGFLPTILIRPKSESGAVKRCSWQPTQPVTSPGSRLRKLCIRLTERSFSSRATKNSGRMAGNSMVADPSGSTGTVPRIRARVKVPPALIGHMPPEKLIGLGSCSRIRSFLISPRRTPAMLRPL